MFVQPAHTMVVGLFYLAGRFDHKTFAITRIVEYEAVASLVVKKEGEQDVECCRSVVFVFYLQVSKCPLFERFGYTFFWVGNSCHLFQFFILHIGVEIVPLSAESF